MVILNKDRFGNQMGNANLNSSNLMQNICLWLQNQTKFKLFFNENCWISIKKTLEESFIELNFVNCYKTNRIFKKFMSQLLLSKIISFPTLSKDKSW